MISCILWAVLNLGQYLVVQLSCLAVEVKSPYFNDREFQLSSIFLNLQAIPLYLLTKLLFMFYFFFWTINQDLGLTIGPTFYFVQLHGLD